MMERQTKIAENGLLLLYIEQNEGLPAIVTKGNPYYSAIKKLYDYENLNLTPAQLQEIDKLYAEKCKEVSKLEVYKGVINCFLNNEDVEIWIVWEGLEISNDVVSFEFLKNNAEEVGESIFFSQEEAEKALAEMKGGAK